TGPGNRWGELVHRLPTGGGAEFLRGWPRWQHLEHQRAHTLDLSPDPVADGHRWACRPSDTPTGAVDRLHPGHWIGTPMGLDEHTWPAAWPTLVRDDQHRHRAIESRSSCRRSTVRSPGASTCP